MSTKWRCSCCTFLNDETTDPNRCSICRAQRMRNISPNPNKRQAELVDLTSSPRADESNDHSQVSRGAFAVASTESARKRRKNHIQDSNMIRQKKTVPEAAVVNRSRQGGGTADKTAIRKDGPNVISRKRNLERPRSSDVYEHRSDDNAAIATNDNDAFAFKTMQNSNDKPVPAKKEWKTKPTNSSKKSRSNSSSMQQQTLFGTIVKDTQKSSGKYKSKKSNLDKSTLRRDAISVDNDFADNPNHKKNTYENKKLEDETNYKALHMHSSKKGKSSVSNIFSETTYEQLHQKALGILNSKFSIDKLRNLQPIALKSALQSKSQIIVMATGGGKSLCYQLPAAVLPGVTIVVSPLIALMVDQVRGLCEKGIEAVMISSAMGEKERQLIWKRLVNTGRKKSDVNYKDPKSNQKGSSVKNGPHWNKELRDIKLLYCTPELIQTTKFRAVLSELAKRGLFAMFAIDEAHCLSTWGHDFRPAYRKLSWIRQEFPDVPCMACTATATKKVIRDIRQVLNFHPSEECHMSTFNRPNLSYEVRYKDTMGNDEALKDLVKTIKAEHANALKDKRPCSGIVYVHKRDDTTIISKTLKKAGIKAAPYHAGLKDQDRKRIQQDWTDGVINVAIATVAFGMGIDLAHVRYVLHWSMSKTVEGFYQESGRAGRDGLRSKSILYYSKDDASKFAFLIRKNFERNQAQGRKSNTDDHSLDALNKMVEFCTLSCCRRKYLLAHFGEIIDPQAICQRTCDYCIDPKKVEQALHTSPVSKAIRETKNQRFRCKRDRLLDGSYNHGIESDGDNDFGIAYSSHSNNNDLGITYSPIDGFATANGKVQNGFTSAKSILSKYEALERQTSEGRNGGFVSFRTKSKKDSHCKEKAENSMSFKKTSVSIPLHMMHQIHSKAPPNESREPFTQNSSKDISEEADLVRAELERIRKRKEMLLAKLKNN